MRSYIATGAAAMILATTSATSAEDSSTSLRISNSDLLSSADVAESAGLQPISIVGVRNGWFSGKVVASSLRVIEDLKAQISDLKSETGTIPADQVQIRYGAPWSGTDSRYGPRGIDILLESPPTDRSTISLWVTVKVPKESKPGIYKGSLTVGVAGGEAIEIPVEMKVLEWTLPDTGSWRTWVEMIQSPDTLAAEYDLQLWSEEHWRMIAQAFKLIGEMGSRVIYVPLICHTNHGNEQSMVRWVAQGTDGYEHDFSIMDRYLDVAITQMGDPKIVVVNAWDVYLNEPEGDIVPDSEVTDRRSHVLSNKRMQDARRALRGKGPAVTLVDSQGENATVFNLPRYEDPACRKLWQPVWSGVRQLMEQRGIADKMMIGMFTDDWPKKQEMAALNELSGSIPWVSHAHWSATQRGRTKLYDLASVGYESTVWDTTVTVNPALNRTYGWQRPAFVARHYRKAGVNRMTPSEIRGLAEVNITGNQRGLARIGGDFWYAIKDKRGRRAGNVSDRYPQSLWRNLDIRASLLAPGPTGPVATVRYEFLREGVQECEARIVIEQALTDEALRRKLGTDLASRCQTLLDERQICLWKAQGLSDKEIQSMGTVNNPGRSLDTRGRTAGGNEWFINSDWQERTEDLFVAAAEVTKRLGATDLQDR
ncbi:MAG: DUF4091 domain-containing protein [Fuerstiella sp.]|nr:DUF4091 domain-containing protein [Fuerstiella sp.]MCP4856820.1 DUF4091 domain-containing protein [Fuerstiella sp.]